MQYKSDAAGLSSCSVWLCPVVPGATPLTFGLDHLFWWCLLRVQHAALVLCRLPERIRPSVLAFGGVADGFVPFEGSHSHFEEELHLASVVMKAVQAGP